jgi:uncharacterized membrane protein YesL
MRILKILTANFEKEGPGINKNDPQKEGFSLFLEILILRFWDIIKLNLIFILYCIPIVTIGPALGAMTSITISMIQRKHIYIFSDFHKAFKSNFKQSFIAGIITIITIVILSYSLAYYYKLAQNSYFFYSIFFFCFFLSVFVGLAWLYVYPLIATVHLSLKDIFKNSILLSIVCFKNTLLGALVYWLIVCFNVLFFPLALPFYILLSFGILSFIGSFATYKGIKTFIIK